MTPVRESERGVVGITGAPGSGKGAAAAVIGRHFQNARLVALDEIGHELLKDEPVREEIRETFSTGVFRIMDGEVSREKLGLLVFSDAAGEDLGKLNAILHPRMVERVKGEIAAWRLQRGSDAARKVGPSPDEAASAREGGTAGCPDAPPAEAPSARRLDAAAPVFVVEGALLIEMGLADLCDHVILVRAPREVRLDRLRRSRGWEDDDLARREGAQLDDEARVARCRGRVKVAVVQNGTTLDDLEQKLETLWEEWT